MTLTYTATSLDAGRKVYHVLRRELALSETSIKRLKAAGAIYVDGLPVFTDRRLAQGETLTADLAKAEPAPGFPAEDGPLEVLYESAGLLVVNKPAGLLSHPSRSRYTGTLANIVSGYLLSREGSAICHAVNRLDRDTSGAVVFAKCAHVKSLMDGAIAEKEYVGAVLGELPDHGVIDAPIRREREGFQRRIVAEDGKRAVTRYEVLRRGEIAGRPVSLVRFRLETGRTHQIRTHCLFTGAPLLGDGLYGTGDSCALSRELSLSGQLLHAASIRFADPLSGEDVTLRAPIRTEDFLRVLGALGLPDGLSDAALEQ